MYDTNQTTATGDDLNPMTTLWYTSPATNWNEALPIGNGFNGAMIFGGISQERFQINDGTFWSGHPHRYTDPNAIQALPEIRRLIFAGQDKEAMELADRAFMGIPKFQSSYQPLADLFLGFKDSSESAQYRRSLDLMTGLHTVQIVQNGVRFERESFVSYSDRVLVMRLTAEMPGQLHFAVRLQGYFQTSSEALDDRTLVVRGQWADDGTKKDWTHNWPGLGIRYSAAVRVLAGSGTVTVSNEGIQINDADSVTILLTTGTSFRKFDDISGDPDEFWPDILANATDLGYERLKERHIGAFSGLMERVSLSLPQTEVSSKPTNERLEAVKAGESDPALASLYFQYGRYLLASSSRDGGQPATLQGIWNKDTNPAWGSKYTTNINLQMNYWPVEMANLSECGAPLFDLMDHLRLTGAEVAQDFYGCRGWVLHHNTDLWRGAAPVDGVWGVWPMGAAWLARHAWEHYRFTGDLAFLTDRAWPQLSEAARFILDFLIEAPEGTPFAGYLVTNPSHSPENAFIRPDGTRSQFTYAATMDIAIIQDLFNNCLDAMATLKRDDEADRAFRAELESALQRLAPMQISPQTGRLQEWVEDFDEVEPGHRHMSHLYGLHPGTSINLKSEPALAEAARKSLEFRLANGGGGTGWSRAWLINFFARLSDGASANQHLKLLLAKSTQPNLLDSHPPFQIDGNFAGTSGIAEMLLQSQLSAEDGRPILQLLPALPVHEWPDGMVSGLRARGAFVVALAWQAGVLRKATVRSLNGGRAIVEYGGNSYAIDLQAGETWELPALS